MTRVVWFPFLTKEQGLWRPKLFFFVCPESTGPTFGFQGRLLVLSPVLSGGGVQLCQRSNQNIGEAGLGAAAVEVSIFARE